VTYDLLIVAVLEKPGTARKRLLAAGVPAQRLLVLKAAKQVLA